VAGIERLQAQFGSLRLPVLFAGKDTQDRAERYLAGVRRRASMRRILFGIVVVLPTVVSAIYYGLIASKRNMFRKLNISFVAFPIISRPGSARC
jgi:hypothetical protein